MSVHGPALSNPYNNSQCSTPRVTLIAIRSSRLLLWRSRGGSGACESRLVPRPEERERGRQSRRTARKGRTSRRHRGSQGCTVNTGRKMAKRHRRHVHVCCSFFPSCCWTELREEAGGHTGAEGKETAGRACPTSPNIYQLLLWHAGAQTRERVPTGSLVVFCVCVARSQKCSVMMQLKLFSH